MDCDHDRPDWETELEQRAEQDRDAREHSCPETSDGRHCGHWDDGERCCACGQEGPGYPYEDYDDEAAEAVARAWLFGE